MKRFALATLTLALAASVQALELPPQLQGKAVVLDASQPDYGRAMVQNAVKPAGMGGVSEALVVRITEDIPVYRMWNGPDKRDARGNTNRLGGWWAYDAPVGSVGQYRSNYEICQTWNDLTWVAKCTLKAGAVVAIGPGQSVSAETCGDPTGKENYPANARDWQTFVDKPWARGSELSCPPDSADYRANPDDISKPLN
ncbi:MAG: hypothetical protein RIR00_1047 [Pseudomonadota bacterium]|jgi:hypothetical protein